MNKLRYQVQLFANAVLDLLIPSVCPACQIASGPGICAVCQEHLPHIENPCRWCGEAQRSAQERCSACQSNGLPHIDRVFVRYAYDGLIAQLVGLAKAAGRPAAVQALAALMPSIGEWAQLHAASTFVVTVVPPSRGRRPGPHLGTACAKQVARDLKLPFRHLLRTKHLAAEQHVLSPAQRRINVSDLFYTRTTVPEIVVLVDDLLTTGATLSAAAHTLKQAGAKRVVAVCLARTPKYAWSGRSTATDQSVKTLPVTAPTIEIV